MSATDELRRMLDERGVEYSDFTSATKNGKAIFKTRWKHECGYAELSEWEPTGSNNLFIQNVEPEQVIAATLGGGKLTAEQVRETVEKHWHDLPAEYDIPESSALPEYSYDWQAIADELNATLGGGECEITNCDSGEMDIDVYALSCGHVAYYPCVYEEPPAFCPECGKAVKR